MQIITTFFLHNFYLQSGTILVLNLVTADARGQLGGGIKEGRGAHCVRRRDGRDGRSGETGECKALRRDGKLGEAGKNGRGQRSEVIRLRPTGYAATRRTAGSSAQLSSSFASYAFGVIKSIRFAVICCKRYKIAARKPLPQEMEDGSESRCQMAKGSDVIRY